MIKRTILPWLSLASLAIVCAGATAIAPGCGSESGEPSVFDDGKSNVGNGNPAGRDSGAVIDPGPQPGFDPDAGTGSIAPRCVNLECRQVACDGGGTTSVSGRVYDPSGRLPLYNAIVYVPNGVVQPFTSGVTCDKCGAIASGSPLVSTITGADGSFRLDNVPVGADIPLVVQLGRWRRQVTLPSVAACANTAVGTTDGGLPLLHLPRNKAEGDIPRMAIATGSADPFQCLLRKMGIDDAEFTHESGNGRVHYFVSNGIDTSPPAPRAADGGPEAGALYSTLNKLLQYDLVYLPCEGNEFRKTDLELKNMRDYTAAGGRIFTTHFGYVWMAHDGNPWQVTGRWIPSTAFDDDFVTADIDRSFPKGQAFADWLVNVDASATPGKIRLKETRLDIAEVYKPPAQRWMTTEAYVDAGEGINSPSVQHLTFNTPIDAGKDDAGEPLQCGKVVYSDFHVSADALNRDAGAFFPQICRKNDYTAQEKALVFMIFDLSACVQNDDRPPVPPPPPPPR